MLGRDNRAFDLYKKIAPAYLEDISEIHRTEPYVYSQMIAGCDAKNHGEAKNSWLTGTAAWTFYNVSRFILGIKPEYDGLSVDPCLPSFLKEYSVNRRYQGNLYHIHVKQTGVQSVSVNGAPITGNILPKGEKEYNAEVTL